MFFKTKTSLCNIWFTFALFLMLGLQKDLICFGYAIQNQFGYAEQLQPQPQTGSGFQLQQVNRFQQFGSQVPVQTFQWGQGRENYKPSENQNPNYYNVPVVANNFVIPSAFPSSNEPLSFSHPILYGNRNIPIFESLVITNKVDPVFTYANYVSKPKPKPIPQFQPQQSQTFQYQQQVPGWMIYQRQSQTATLPLPPPGHSPEGMLNLPPANQWGRQSQVAGPRVASPVTMMTMQSNSGGGTLLANPKYNFYQSRFTPGPGVLPSFRSIRKAPPGSFFIPIRTPDGSFTYAAEPNPAAPKPHEPMWSTDPRFTVGAIPPSQMIQYFPALSEERSSLYNGRHSYQSSSSRNLGRPTLTPGRGQKSSREYFYPFPAASYYYPSPQGGYVDNNTDVIYLGQLNRRHQINNGTGVPAWIRSNFFQHPIPPNMSHVSSSLSSSPNVVRQTNYSPMQINPAMLMVDPSTVQTPIFSQARRSIPRATQKQEQQGLSEWMPQPQPGQGPPFHQFQQQQNPQKSNRFGPQAYPVNEQNRQFQPRPGQQQQPQYIPFPQQRGQIPGQGFFHQQQSWGSGGPILQSPAQPAPFWDNRGGGRRGPIFRGEGSPSGFPDSAVTTPPRPREQGIGLGSVARIDSNSRPEGGSFGWNINNNGQVPGGFNSRSYEFGGKQYQTWNPNFGNQNEQKEPVDHPKETKTPVLHDSGGEVQVYSKSSSIQNFDGRLPRHNETKKDYKFTSDSTILQRHLQQAKQILREQKSRELSHRNATPTSNTPGSEGRSQQSAIIQSFPTKSTLLLRDPSDTVSNPNRASSSETVPTATNFDDGFFRPKSKFSSSATGTSWFVGDEPISSPGNTSSTSTNTASRFQLSQLQQLEGQQRFISVPQSPTDGVLSTDVSSHGRFGRHVESLSFSSAEDLLAMDLEPLELDE